LAKQRELSRIDQIVQVRLVATSPSPQRDLDDPEILLALTASQQMNGGFLEQRGMRAPANDFAIDVIAPLIEDSASTARTGSPPRPR